MKQHGANTREIAEKLKRKIDGDPQRYKGVMIFYDHGDSSKHEVCQPTTYMGRRYVSDSTLSGVDIVVTKNREILLAVEVEESSVRPKTVLGDVFGIATTDRIRIQGQSYPIKNITLIVAISVESKGKRLEKYRRLERHLGRYFKANPSGAIGKIRIIPCSIDDLVRRIERVIRLETGKVA